jgi:hypothetical protein
MPRLGMVPEWWRQYERSRSRSVHDVKQHSDHSTIGAVRRFAGPEFGSMPLKFARCDVSITRQSVSNIPVEHNRGGEVGDRLVGGDPIAQRIHALGAGGDKLDQQIDIAGE